MKVNLTRISTAAVLGAFLTAGMAAGMASAATPEATPVATTEATESTALPTAGSPEDPYNQPGYFMIDPESELQNLENAKDPVTGDDLGAQWTEEQVNAIMNSEGFYNKAPADGSFGGPNVSGILRATDPSVCPSEYVILMDLADGVNGQKFVTPNGEYARIGTGLYFPGFTGTKEEAREKLSACDYNYTERTHNTGSIRMEQLPDQFDYNLEKEDLTLYVNLYGEASTRDSLKGKPISVTVSNGADYRVVDGSGAETSTYNVGTQVKISTASLKMDQTYVVTVDINNGEYVFTDEFRTLSDTAQRSEAPVTPAPTTPSETTNPGATDGTDATYGTDATDAPESTNGGTDDSTMPAAKLVNEKDVYAPLDTIEYEVFNFAPNSKLKVFVMMADGSVVEITQQDEPITDANGYYAGKLEPQLPLPETTYTVLIEDEEHNRAIFKFTVDDNNPDTDPITGDANTAAGGTDDANGVEANTVDATELATTGAEGIQKLGALTAMVVMASAGAMLAGRKVESKSLN